MKNAKRRETLLFFLLLSLTSCSVLYNPATGKEETIIYDRESEIAAGKVVAKAFEENYKVARNDPHSQYIAWVGERVASTNDRIDLPYRFILLDTDDVNAMALPGGPIYITRGLVELTSQDELACVLGHEVGHIAARHVAKRLERSGMELPVLAALIAMGNAVSEAIYKGLAILELGYSQEDEILADCLGAKYAGKAGFDPSATVTFLEKLRALEREKGVGGGWLRSHPPTVERIRSAKEWLEKNKDQL